jgi:methylenetetrahydrofolate dehydrogenase (NADP+)/methenyltetrahydrofolate cyclohydrolase
VTLCHQGTRHLQQITKNADVIITAMGSPLFLQPHHIKEGSIVIDVGINRIENRLVGDVDFEKVHHKTFAITPVPGGVGPMTVYGLLQNTLKAHKQKKVT